MLQGRDWGTPADHTEWGDKMRKGFLQLVRERLGFDRSASADGDGAPAPAAADTATWQQVLEFSSGLDIATYLRVMATHGEGQESSGGYGELELMCCRWGVRGWVGPQTRLASSYSPPHPRQTGGHIALLWSETHWDALRLDASLWAMLKQARPT